MTGEHADLATLLSYWQRELEDAQESAFEKHYFGCALCSAALAEVEAIAAGVRGAFASGRVGAVITPAFATLLRSHGVRVREYRVPRNGSVNCSVAPEDQVLLGRLQVPLDGVERLDAIAVHADGHRLEDVPFDASTGEVLLAPSVALMRSLPEHQEVVRLVAVGPGGDRVLGEYTFNHSPHRAPL
jgi:hypothetical protein